MPDDTSAVRVGFELDTRRLERHLRENVPGFEGALTIRQFDLDRVIDWLRSNIPAGARHVETVAGYAWQTVRRAN